MQNLHFYAQRKTVKNGTAQTPANYSYNTQDEAERQYHLLCASGIANADECDVVSVEHGTIEHGPKERWVRIFDNEEPTPYPEEQEAE